jgi:O-succinylhomoserine sulfhydrylase
MRASFAEEKIETSIAVTVTNKNEFVEKVCKMEGATAGLLLEWPIYSTMAAYYNQAIISFRSSVLGQPFIVCELFGIPETTYFDINNPDIIESCIKPNILLPNHLLTQRLIL